MDKNQLNHLLKIVTQCIIDMDNDLKRLDWLELEILAIKTSIQTRKKSLHLAICPILEMIEGNDWTNLDVGFDNNCNYQKNTFTDTFNIDNKSQEIIALPIPNQKSVEEIMKGIKATTSIIEDVKTMMIELKIRGSVRERKSGLIELRTQAFGSIYGRSKDEIELKLSKRLKEDKKDKKNKTINVPLLSEFYNENYLPNKKANLAEKSIKDMQTWFRFIIKSGMDKPINRYTTVEIEKFLYSIPQTRKRQIVCGLINNMLNQAKRLGLIKTNPCDNVEKMKHEKKIGCALSFADQFEFFDRLYSYNNNVSDMERLYLTFVYLTGTRRNEALSLTLEDIDFENNTLHIAGTKTKTSNRTMPMFPLVKRLLKTIPLGNSNKNKVFTLSYDQAQDAMKKITKDYHLHELRHTFGTIAICVQKLDPKTVSLYMGHKDPYMTLNIYTHSEQLDKSLFYNGGISENDKTLILQNKYNAVLEKISKYIENIPIIYPKNQNK